MVNGGVKSLGVMRLTHRNVTRPGLPLTTLLYIFNSLGEHGWVLIFIGVESKLIFSDRVSLDEQESEGVVGGWF